MLAPEAQLLFYRDSDPANGLNGMKPAVHSTHGPKSFTVLKEDNSFSPDSALSNLRGSPCTSGPLDPTHARPWLERTRLVKDDNYISHGRASFHPSSPDKRECTSNSGFHRVIHVLVGTVVLLPLDEALR